jgi:hypothetical protein
MPAIENTNNSSPKLMSAIHENDDTGQYSVRRGNVALIQAEKAQHSSEVTGTF